MIVLGLPEVSALASLGASTQEIESTMAMNT
jgi:hypothetical protein